MGEFTIGMVAMLLAYRLTPASVPNAGVQHLAPLPAAFAYATIMTLTAHALGLHNNLNLRSRWRILLLSIGNALVATSLLTVFISFVLYAQIGRIILVLSCVLSAMTTLILRLGFRQKLRNCTVTLEAIGEREFVEYIHELCNATGTRFELVNGNADQDSSLDIVVVQKIESDEAAEKLLALANEGVQVFTPAAFLETYFYRIPPKYISADWIFSIDFQRLHPFFHPVKRSLDICLALSGLVLGAPLILLAAVAIYLESPGPIFYSQIRVGLFQRPFRIWKLRSMRVDSEQSGPQWAKAKDSRVTRIGRILRQSRIDELPQFWNILCGEMAFVGPRPERPEFTSLLAAEIPFYRQRHLVKPGLTGWAQICYPYGASSKDAWHKLSYDLYYIKNLSLTLDLQILVQTFGAVSRGAR